MRRAILLSAIGVSMLAALAGCQRQAGQAAQAAQAPGPPEKAEVRWTCPMHPAYTADRPGACPICGMDLVRKEMAEAAPREEQPAGLAPVTIDAERGRLIGLRTVPARRAPLTSSIRAPGRVVFDETRVHHVHTRYEAYVEDLYADFTGKFVRRGEPLVSLYSPDLYTAEQEYLIALRGGGGLREAARQKLLLWQISPSDIAELERTGKASHTLKLYAPISGYVIGRTAVHGMRVRPEDSLFDIVDLSRMWVLGDIYEHELPRVRIGQRATMTLPYWPDRTWAGRVTYIFPSVDPKTRTVRVRLEFDNPQGELKAEMFATVHIEVAARMALQVPDDAVVDSGVRKVVFVSLGGGRLQPREVRTGDREAGFYEIRGGLREGEQIATGASFLLDSESRMRAGLSAIATPDQKDQRDQRDAGQGGDEGHAGHAGHAGHGGGRP
jgi:Cu(I)/Ag(I) efflux system membrane fusion protein